MKLQTIARRIEAIEKHSPKSPEPIGRDLSVLSDDELETMAIYSERIIAAGRPDDPTGLFTPAERQRISEILGKTEHRA